MGTPTRGGVAVNLKSGARWGSGPRQSTLPSGGLKELQRQAQGEAGPFEGKEDGEGPSGMSAYS